MQIPPFRHGEEEQGDWNKQKVSFVKTTKYLDSTFDENLFKIISCNCVRKSSYLKRQMLRTLVFVVIPGVSVLIRGHQFAPKLSICSFGGGHVYRKAQSVSDAFKCTI